MKRPRSARVHLPPLDADEALRFVALLQRVIDAIWRAHGIAMSEQLLDGHLAGPPDDLADDDRDLPF